MNWVPTNSAARDLQKRAREMAAEKGISKNQALRRLADADPEAFEKADAGGAGVSLARAARELEPVAREAAPAGVAKGGPGPVQKKIEQRARERVERGLEDSVRSARIALYRRDDTLSERVRKERQRAHREVLKAKRRAAKALRKADPSVDSWLELLVQRGARINPEDPMAGAKRALEEVPAAAEHLAAELREVPR